MNRRAGTLLQTYVQLVAKNTPVDDQQWQTLVDYGFAFIRDAFPSGSLPFPTGIEPQLSTPAVARCWCADPGDLEGCLGATWQLYDWIRCAGSTTIMKGGKRLRPDTAIVTKEEFNRWNQLGWMLHREKTIYHDPLYQIHQYDIFGALRASFKNDTVAREALSNDALKSLVTKVLDNATRLLPSVEKPVEEPNDNKQINEIKDAAEWEICDNWSSLIGFFCTDIKTGTARPPSDALKFKPIPDESLRIVDDVIEGVAAFNAEVQKELGELSKVPVGVGDRTRLHALLWFLCRLEAKILVRTNRVQKRIESNWKWRNCER